MPESRITDSHSSVTVFPLKDFGHILQISKQFCDKHSGDRKLDDTIPQTSERKQNADEMYFNGPKFI